MGTHQKKELSEKKKGVHRIVTNYGRLIATMAMGIATVPLQISWIGMDGFGLLGLVGSSVGIGGMLQDMTRSSMVRELGSAWHKKDDDLFKETYAASFKVSLIVTALTAIVFGAIISIIPLLQIKEEWVTPAQWITACEGLATCVIVLFSPTINLLIVREQFFWHNAWTVIRRSAFLIATIIPYLIMQVHDVPKGLYIYGTILLIINTASTLLLVVGTTCTDKRFIPTIKGSTPMAMKRVVGTFGWNSSVVLAVNLQERIAAFIMNIFFGLWGNAIFSLALRLVSYIRMTTLGLTFGLDSVSVRLSSDEDKSSLQNMFRHTTRMLSFVAFPSMVVVFVLAEPLIRIWVGRSVTNPSELLPPSELLVKIMVLGLTCRAISDGWMKLFYGAGHIHKYAPYVLIGGLCNPILSILCIKLMPESSNYAGAAIAYSTIFLVVHMFIMPKVTSGEVNLSLRIILAPLLRPLFISLALTPVLFIGYFISDTSLMGWVELLISVSVYGVLYGIASWWFILSKRERKGLIRLTTQAVTSTAGSS
ncbi:MAG: polysaccharide biosynthesis protein [Phycisphaerae bacterium]|nr:polysaccharide biosynthesis protein [Phycisphaerae bacterium]